jgi:hypothetical protein
MNEKTILFSVRDLKEILGNAIVYADYIAGNHADELVRSGAKQFSADCEKELARIK